VTEASSPSMPSSLSPAERSSVDAFMRRLLRVDTVEGGAKAAQAAMSSSILVSAVRCVLTYLVIPLLQPMAHAFGTVSRPLSVLLCLLGGFMSIRSMRRFWATDHPKRWAYTAFASVLLTYLAYGLVTDVAHILS
jgi:hypothetical protein